MCDPRPETQGGPKAPPLLGGVREEARAPPPDHPRWGPAASPQPQPPNQTPTHPGSPRPLWAPAVPSAQYVLGVSCISALDLFHSSKRELRLRKVELLALGHSASGGPGQDS